MPPAPRKRPEAPATLDVAAWIDAAMDMLAEGGVDAVRIDPLAKRLGVTRGSFYWHFKDRDALHQAMLKQWRKRASYAVGARIDSQNPAPNERLKQNLALPQASARSKHAAAIELAIRLWARRDKEAARAVAHIDRVRLKYYAQLYAETGLKQEQARERAFLFYGALMARAYIVTDADTDVGDRLAALLLEKP
jgi:Transcriptional regulator